MTRGPLFVRLILCAAAALLPLRCVSTTHPAPVDDETRAIIEQLRGAVATSPDNGTRIYMLAAYLDRAGDTDESLKWLAELQRVGWTHGVNDHDFMHARSLARYGPLTEALNERDAQVARATPAFTLHQRDLIPEGIAHDPVSGDFFVSSLHHRKVVRVNPGGTVSDFVAEGSDGIMSTLGMKVDAKRRLLWVIAAAVPEMRGFDETQGGRSGVFVYDLGSGRMTSRYTVGLPEQPSLLNDVVLLTDGSALITDTARGSIMRAVPGTTALETWLPSGSLLFPNGIALSDDGSTLFVADFNGVTRIDMTSRSGVPLLLADRTETLSGIDGLVWTRGALIGIQNGVGRPRVIRIVPAAAPRQASQVEVLEAGNSLFDEPTTGAVAGDAYYFMANPQLRAFDENHRIWPDQKLRDVVILKLPL